MASHIAFLSLAFLSSFATSIPLSSIEGRDDKQFSLRVLPLGASITFGAASSDGNGYRQALREQLRFAGWEVNMVGNEQNGTMHDNDNSGYPGLRVDEIIKKAEQVVDRQPNLITINAGTNDAVQNKAGFEVETTGKRMDKMLDMLFEKIPGVTILLSTILTNGRKGVEPRVNIINPQYRAIVERRRKKNQRIVLAEMHESDHPWLGVDDLVDGTHPNDGGYKKMAAIWWEAFQVAEKAGMLQPPNKPSLINRCENKQATKLDANKIKLPQNFYEPVQPVQYAELAKNDVREAVWADNGHFYIYKMIDHDFRDGAELDLNTNCQAKDVRWLDVNDDGLDDFICLDIGNRLSIKVNKGGKYPPTFEDVGLCTVPHSGDDGPVKDPKLPRRP